MVEKSRKKVNSTQAQVMENGKFYSKYGAPWYLCRLDITYLVSQAVFSTFDFFTVVNLV